MMQQSTPVDPPRVELSDQLDLKWLWEHRDSESFDVKQGRSDVLRRLISKFCQSILKEGT